MNTPEAAARVDLGARTLERLRGAGKGPRFLKICGKVRYRVADLEEWLEGCAHTPAAQHGPGAEEDDDDHGKDTKDDG